MGRAPRRAPGPAGARVRRLLGAAALLTFVYCPSALAAAIVVNSTDQAIADDGACTLPEAIQAANTNTAPPGAGECAAGQAAPAVRDTIRFTIPGTATLSSPHTISISSAPLETLSEPVVIDGATEPDFGSSPVIEVRDDTTSPGALVLGPGASGSIIRGLAISAAGGSAITINDSNDSIIAGNFLGVRPNGTTAGSVAGAGISMRGSRNRIGGIAEADHNLIADNGLDGITIEGSTSADNPLLGNRIRSNGPDADDLAIDLNVSNLAGFAGDGASPNDTDDSDDGPNGAQNHPVVTAAVPELSLIRGQLQSKPATGFRVELFTSTDRGPGGSALAERLVGTVIVVTGPSGFATFGLIASPGAFKEGEWISATATPRTANATALATSEVAEAIEAPTCDIEGTEGDDVLTGTSAGEVICGRGGNDTLDGGGGNDFLLGGEGDDLLRGGADADLLYGEGGFDAADYSQVSSNVNADLASGQADRDGQGASDTLTAIEALIGGPKGDVLGGDNLDNAIDARGGDDVVSAEGGADTISGGPGEDALSGGDGNDRIFGGEGRDVLFGGLGNDHISGGTEDDSIDGGPGNDALLGEDGSDSLAGQQGKDLISGGPGADRLEAGGAADLLFGGPGPDRIDGDRGNDRMAGQGSNDRMKGGQGKDKINGGTGNDRLGGGAGSDVVRGGKGKDVLRGGSGTDKLFGDAGRDRLRGDKGKDRCNGGRGRDHRRAPGCVKKKRIP